MSTSMKGMEMSKKHEVGTGWAVVTGASSGLGAIFAEKLAERGLCPWCWPDGTKHVWRR